MKRFLSFFSPQANKEVKDVEKNADGENKEKNELLINADADQPKVAEKKVCHRFINYLRSRDVSLPKTRFLVGYPMPSLSHISLSFYRVLN